MTEIEKDEVIKRCQAAANKMRINTLKLASLDKSKGTHVGSALSIIEILATAYCGIMNLKLSTEQAKDRDRFILSKGHGTMALYAALEVAQLITEDQLFTFNQNGGSLGSTSKLNLDLGLEYANGTLGFGLSYAVGLALASIKSGNRGKIFVLLGDGECNEGAVWEAAMSAQHFKLGNLTAIVDLNSMQSDGSTCDVLDIQLADIWTGYGWEVITVEDGHDVSQLYQAFSAPRKKNHPRVIIARTIKGKGISFMENNNEWHHKRLTQEMYDVGLEEITERS